MAGLAGLEEEPEAGMMVWKLRSGVILVNQGMFTRVEQESCDTLSVGRLGSGGREGTAGGGGSMEAGLVFTQGNVILNVFGGFVEDTKGEGLGL